MSVASIQINIRLDSDTYGKVKDRADGQGIKPSEWVRLLIKSEVGGIEFPASGNRSDLETRLSILEREMIDLKSTLSIVNDQIPSDSEINDSKADSVGVSSGQGLTQKQFCQEFPTSAPTIKRWLDQGIFGKKTTKEDGSYWEKRDDGLYYHVFPII